MCTANPTAATAAELPVVFGFTPHEGVPGTEVKIAGEHFDHVRSIEFAGGIRSDFRLVTTTMLKVDVPAGAESGWILLRSENGGAWTPSSFRVIAPAPGRLALSPPYPSPGAGPFRVGFNLPTPLRVQVDVLDLTGRRVRSLVDAASPAGLQETQWDGRDAVGRRAPPGLYLVQLRFGDGIERRRLVVLH